MNFNRNITGVNFIKKAALIVAFLGIGFCISHRALAQPNQVNSRNATNNSDIFKKKGFYVDLRSQVMTMDALKQLARDVASMGINTLVMEYEATYPYQKHPTISNEVAYSRKDIANFIGYCSSVGVEVIPVQECFGHVQYILRHDRYRYLSEDMKGPSPDLSQVCPLKAKGDSLLFSDLLSDMAAMHPSRYIHIGGDETRLLGHDEACRAMVEKEGQSKLFVTYMKMISEIVLKQGKIPVMWADMLLKYPEAADLLPKETILLDWNYGWKPNHFGDVANLQKKGFVFWGAASLRSHPDNWFVTDWMTHFNNQRDFIPYARKSGYKAMFMTSWSTSGLYSFTWDVGSDVQDMEPIRNNYPLSGFRILIACYAKALKQTAPIDARAFVIDYAQTRFGLSAMDGEKLWKTFNLVPELIVNGKPAKSKDIATMIGQNLEVIKILGDLKPNKHLKEFSHFRLMADLRAYYLAYKQILATYNAEDFTIAKAKNLGLLHQVQVLLDQSKELDKRFAALNKGYLKAAEITKQNAVRNRPVIQLFLRLNNLHQHISK